MADPDLQIKGWREGGVHPDPEIAGGGLSQKHFFSALQASVRSKNKVGGRWVPRAPPLDIHSQNKFTTVSVSIASLIVVK